MTHARPRPAPRRRAAPTPAAVADDRAFVSNFAFVEPYLPTAAALGQRAEHYLTTDANTALYKLRQLVEDVARKVAENHRLPWTDLYTLLRDLERRDHLPDAVAAMWHQVRRVGNEAVHELGDQHANALQQLRNARGICVWYVAEFGDPDLKPPKFRVPPPPDDPAAALAEAHAEQRALAERLAALEASGTELRAETARLSRPRVLYAQASLGQLDGLPEPVRVATVAALAGYREAPDAVALSRFDDATDDKFRWFAVDDDRCAVVAISPHCDVHLVAWIGELDGAIAWVRGRRVEVNATLGSIQIYGEPPDPPRPAADGLFAAVSDEALLRSGVPPLLLPAVRALRGADALAGLTPYLPQEAADVLAAIAGGNDVETAIAEAGLRVPAAAVDPADFDVAVGHQATRRAFAELDDRTLEEMLHAPIEQWRVFLHPSQARVVRTRANGPVRVLGGAGTGKTVALLHRVVHLIRHELPEPTDAILVTTYSRTLATELERRLGALLTADERRRVTVGTLHSVATRLLRDAGRRVQVVQDKTRDACFDAAMRQADPKGTFSRAFYQDEWDLVVQSQGITDRAGYFAASRQGRGTSLNRKDRAAVWAVFERYRAELVGRDRVEWADAFHLARTLLDQGADRPYRSVLVDEVQDFGAVELRLIRALAPEARADLFLVGDAHQRIYKLGTTLGGCGIQIRGRSYRLKVNYRTTERIQSFAFAMLAGEAFDDLDGSSDTLAGYRSLRVGTPPVVRAFPSAEAERAAVVSQVSAWIAAGVAPAAICVATRTGYALRGYREALEGHGLRVAHLEDDDAEALPPDAVRTSTLHRLKGTEFSRVLLAGTHDGAFPLRPPKVRQADEASVEDFLHQERCLMYVAATRARDELVITGAGAFSPVWNLPEALR